jgi:hypothetical protein
MPRAYLGSMEISGKLGYVMPSYIGLASSPIHTCTVLWKATSRMACRLSARSSRPNLREQCERKMKHCTSVQLQQGLGDFTGGPPLPHHNRALLQSSLSQLRVLSDNSQLLIGDHSLSSQKLNSRNMNTNRDLMPILILQQFILRYAHISNNTTLWKSVLCHASRAYFGGGRCE